jgi:hypothetical protein
LFFGLHGLLRQGVKDFAFGDRVRYLSSRACIRLQQYDARFGALFERCRLFL